jgi:hypothetical protein
MVGPLFLMFIAAAALVMGALVASAALFAAPIIGASVIRWIVQRTNRHDDPHHAKCPPDAP